MSWAEIAKPVARATAGMALSAGTCSILAEQLLGCTPCARGQRGARAVPAGRWQTGTKTAQGDPLECLGGWVLSVPTCPSS